MSQEATRSLDRTCKSVVIPVERGWDYLNPRPSANVVLHPVRRTTDRWPESGKTASAHAIFGWQRLLCMAGVKSSADFSVEDIWTASAAISTVDSLVYSARDSYFEFQNLSDDLTDSEVVALYFNEAKLADAGISYSARVALRRTNDPLWQYRSTTIEALDVRPLVDDLGAYGMEQARSNALRIVINPRNLTFNPIDAVSPAIAKQK